MVSGQSVAAASVSKAVASGSCAASTASSNFYYSRSGEMTPKFLGSVSGFRSRFKPTFEADFYYKAVSALKLTKVQAMYAVGQINNV